MVIRYLTLAFFLSPCSWAQSVDVKDVNANNQDSTTIEIRKGKAAELSKCEALWEVQDGQAEVMGEPGGMNREARANWKQACTDWKAEFRADNKENKIISVSCGVPTCEGDVGNKSCTSKANYKIKTRLN